MVRVDPLTTDDRAVWDALAHLYAYDFSEIVDLALGQDGQFPRDDGFDAVWDADGFDGYIIRVGDEVAGFAIVSEVHPQDYDILQFMVLRKFRRQGVGRAAAEILFEAYKGQWVIEQIPENKDAQIFWRVVVDAFTGGQFEESKGTVIAQKFRVS